MSFFVPLIVAAQKEPIINAQARPPFLPPKKPLASCSVEAGHMPRLVAFFPPGCLPQSLNSQQFMALTAFGKSIGRFTLNQSSFTQTFRVSLQFTSLLSLLPKLNSLFNIIFQTPFRSLILGLYIKPRSMHYGACVHSLNHLYSLLNFHASEKRIPSSSEEEDTSKEKHSELVSVPILS